MKPLVVGSPIAASVSSTKNTEYTGISFGQSSVRRELARMAALVDHADEQEEPTGDQAMAHHLDHRALDADQVEADEPQHHEPRWLIDEYAMIFLISVCTSARHAP